MKLILDAEQRAKAADKIATILTNKTGEFVSSLDTYDALKEAGL